MVTHIVGTSKIQSGMMTMTDLNETLKTMQEHADFEGRIPHNEFRALLSAVQNVLALCNRAPGYPGTVRKSDVRKALTDALEGGA